MIIKCHRHGGQPLLTLSQDVFEVGFDNSQLLVVVYESHGFPLLAYYLSHRFADKHGVTEGTFPIPSEMPKWTTETTGCCASCFVERFGEHPELGL